MKKLRDKISEWGYLPGAVIVVVWALVYIVYKFLQLM